MALASDVDFSVDTIQRKILDDTDGILEFLNDINAKAPRNSKFICDEIIGSSRRMTQGRSEISIWNSSLKNSRLRNSSFGILKFLA